MNIILTHEQADFDAIASLLAAYLLDDSAVPVLPRKVNRNVKAFLGLYEDDLPFIGAKELGKVVIDAVTLVDTQSMVSVRGMKPDTRVHIVDHHPLREDLPPGWKVNIMETGATTTILVDSLRETNGDLSMIQATLLLLGIYEDTGSLTYSRTTATDLRAAAYLLEQGASLQIAANYINHPLSDVQQELYDQLRKATELIQLHGHSIMIVCGSAQGMDEELSSIAHKIRDLLEPDALFLLVTTRAGIQMIARSTSDQIDVSEIVAHFGGGGHDRAAAGLIHGKDLEAVRTELLNILPKYVRPAVTVAEIMSRDPQLLTPETPVEEAAQRMRRFGYEGYPVVRQGEVVGLLTRRSVDRAIGHNLKYPIERLMDAGSFSVGPDDSIEHLQRRISESGWGQMPVVEKESGKIIGIVTRTDLLKFLSPKDRQVGKINLSDRLEKVLPPQRLELLQLISQAAHQQHVALFIVGGFVRDLLLEKPSLDFDLVVEGDAISLAKSLVRKYGGRVTSHARFGTAKWHLRDEKMERSDLRLLNAGLQFVDLVSARTEFYTHPTALPTVEKGSIKLDLHRRDFTINTLALRLDGRHYGELHDHWGGLNDLRSRLVRVLHSLSFVDDPTRILRAVRFEQRLSFGIEERTLQLLLEAKPLMDRLSGDRIRHELNHILGAPDSTRILNRMHQLGLLSAIHPSLQWDDWLKDKLDSIKTPVEADWGFPVTEDWFGFARDLSYCLWTLRLSREQIFALLKRMKFSISLARIIQSAAELWNDRWLIARMSPKDAVDRLEDVPPLARYAVYLAVGDGEGRAVLREYSTRWRKISPTIDGNALRSLGIPPGPVYRQILSALKEGWLDGRITSPEQERAILDEMLKHG